MPQYRAPQSLETICLNCVSVLVRDALVLIDSKWNFSKALSPPKKSPRASPLSPRTAGSLIPVLASSSASGTLTSTPQVSLDQDKLRDWLLQMPTMLLEEVVVKVVSLIENDITDDKDRKIILTLINIEKTNPSHFSFGVYSLLICLATTRIARLPFSTKLWFCIWEFEQLTTSNHLRHCLSESIPKLTCLTTVNFAYIATDQIMWVFNDFFGLHQLLCDINSSFGIFMSKSQRKKLVKKYHGDCSIDIEKCDFDDLFWRAISVQYKLCFAKTNCTREILHL